jgi:hypothetical protein
MCLLCLLQDKAKPRPFRVVDRSLRLELGAGAEEVFAEFSAEATAAASLAQVHKARLMDGRQVGHLQLVPPKPSPETLNHRLYRVVRVLCAFLCLAMRSMHVVLVQAPVPGVLV